MTRNDGLVETTARKMVPRPGSPGRVAERILQDPDVRRWHADLCRGSLRTGAEYLRVLERVMRDMDLEPAEFVALGQNEAEQALMDYVDRAVRGVGRKAPLAGKSIEYHKAVVLSWMKFRHIPCRVDIKVPRTTRYNPRNEDTKIPEREDLKRLLTAVDARAAIVITSMAYAALRPRVLADQENLDGLRFADLPESKFEGKKIVFTKVPTAVRVRANLSKNKKAYTTFFPQELCRYIEADVARRFKDGEELSKDSLVVAPVGGYRANVLREGNPEGIMSKVGLYKIASRAMKAVGVPGNPYIWKSYCSDRLALGEADGLTTKYRVYIMGHSGSVTDNYSTRKAELSSETLEAMRAAYEVVARKHLEAFPEVKVEDDRLAHIKVMLSAFGLPPDQIKGLDIGNMLEGELLNLVQTKLMAPAPAAALPPLAPWPEPINLSKVATPQPAPQPAVTAAKAPPKQRIVSPDQAVQLLEENWTLVQVLPNGSYLVGRPD